MSNRYDLPLRRSIINIFNVLIYEIEQILIKLGLDKQA